MLQDQTVRVRKTLIYNCRHSVHACPNHDAFKQYFLKVKKAYAILSQDFRIISTERRIQNELVLSFSLLTFI